MIIVIRAAFACISVRNRLSPPSPQAPAQLAGYRSLSIPYPWCSVPEGSQGRRFGCQAAYIISHCWLHRWVDAGGTHRHIGRLSQGDDFGRHNVVVSTSRLFHLLVPPLEPPFQPGKSGLRTRETKVLPQPPRHKAQEPIDDISGGIRVEYRDEFRVQLVDDPSKLHLRQTGRVENFGVHIGKRRRKVALE